MRRLLFLTLLCIHSIVIYAQDFPSLKGKCDTLKMNVENLVNCKTSIKEQAKKLYDSDSTKLAKVTSELDTVFDYAILVLDKTKALIDRNPNDTYSVDAFNVVFRFYQDFLKNTVTGNDLKVKKEFAEILDGNFKELKSCLSTFEKEYPNVAPESVVAKKNDAKEDEGNGSFEKTYLFWGAIALLALLLVVSFVVLKNKLDQHNEDLRYIEKQLSGLESRLSNIKDEKTQRTNSRIQYAPLEDVNRALVNLRSELLATIEKKNEDASLFRQNEKYANGSNVQFDRATQGKSSSKKDSAIILYAQVKGNDGLYKASTDDKANDIFQINLTSVGDSVGTFEVKKTISQELLSTLVEGRNQIVPTSVCEISCTSNAPSGIRTDLVGNVQKKGEEWLVVAPTKITLI